MNTKKQYCLNGHDTFITGRYKSGNCKICWAAYYKRKGYTYIDPQYHQKRAKAHNGTRRSYTNMLTRCYCVSHSGYKNYGGKGITVCGLWKGQGGYEQFLRDMGPRPTKKHSIDRIDNNKGYNPTNCKWSTPLEQGRHKKGK
jgi:hypothetical protein